MPLKNRVQLLNTLYVQLCAAGLTETDQRDIYARLLVTNTAVLRDCVAQDLVGQAERLALKHITAGLLASGCGRAPAPCRQKGGAH